MAYDAKLSALASQLLQKNLTVACAESCTGGLISYQLTTLPGSSAWFDCGLITYSNHAKEQLLQVPSSLIQTVGAVSAEVATAMVIGLFERTEASIGLSVTGIAGPSGGSPEKPVGTVFIAVAQRFFEPVVYQYCFINQSRDHIRYSSYEKAVDALLIAIS